MWRFLVRNIARLFWRALKRLAAQRRQHEAYMEVGYLH
jgi:hypothetical protein